MNVYREVTPVALLLLVVTAQITPALAPAAGNGASNF